MTLLIGVMSGTSMDAVDAVLADVSEVGVTVVADRSLAIDPQLKARLDAALATETLAALEAWRLDAEVGELMARAVLGLLEAAGADPARIAAVGSHGQTVYHAPDAQPPITVQLGDPNVIAARTGLTVVSDFRRMDLAAGGQGAPLAPAFHAFAFGSAEEARAVLNVGGIANLTLLAAGGGDAAGGFDTGPGNTLMDLWARRHLGRDFDENGRLAAGGRVDPDLLARLLADEYFQRPPPKSTGRERFHMGWLEACLEGRAALAPADVQRTLCQLTVESVARALERFARPVEPRALYVCGGGALNPVLGERLEGCPVASTERLGVPPRCVEGAAFAWLAGERLAGRAAGHPRVTGARRSSVLGGVYRP